MVRHGISHAVASMLGALAVELAADGLGAQFYAAAIGYAYLAAEWLAAFGLPVSAVVLARVGLLLAVGFVWGVIAKLLWELEVRSCDKNSQRSR